MCCIEEKNGFFCVSSSFCSRAAVEEQKSCVSERLALGVCIMLFADTFANILNTETDDFQTEVKTTAGSAANLRLLSEGYIQLAVVQADLLQDAWNGEGSFAGGKTCQGYGAVAALYTEACQIIVRDDSSIINMDDLLGKTVSVGEKESGTEQNAEKISRSQRFYRQHGDESES